LERQISHVSPCESLSRPSATFSPNQHLGATNNNMAARGINKPFKPLTLKAPARPVDEAQETIILDSPPAKKRKLLIHDNRERPAAPIVSISASASAPRKPLLPVKNPAAYAEATAGPSEDSPEGYYTVLW